MSEIVARVEGKDSSGEKVVFFTCESNLSELLADLVRNSGRVCSNEKGEERFVEFTQVCSLDLFDKDGMMILSFGQRPVLSLA